MENPHQEVVYQRTQLGWGVTVDECGKEGACNAETQVPSLVREDPLEKGMATHSTIPWGRKESDTTK